MKSVPTVPKTKPAFIKASGIASIPVPMLPFKRCIMVSKLLHGNDEIKKTKILKNNKKQYNFKIKMLIFIYVKPLTLLGDQVDGLLKSHRCKDVFRIDLG